MKSAQARLNRRRFLITVSAGGAATAAAVAGKVVTARQPTAGGIDKRRGKGYEESAHVRNYYRTTKI